MVPLCFRHPEQSAARGSSPLEALCTRGIAQGYELQDVVQTELCDLSKTSDATGHDRGCLSTDLIASVDVDWYRGVGEGRRPDTKSFLSPRAATLRRVSSSQLLSISPSTTSTSATRTHAHSGHFAITCERMTLWLKRTVRELLFVARGTSGRTEVCTYNTPELRAGSLAPLLPMSMLQAYKLKSTTFTSGRPVAAPARVRVCRNNRCLSANVRAEKVLIANTKGGGHAFIGLYLAKQLMSAGHTVTILNDGDPVSCTMFNILVPMR